MGGWGACTEVEMKLIWQRVEANEEQCHRGFLLQCVRMQQEDNDRIGDDKGVVLANTRIIQGSVSALARPRIKYEPK